MSQPSMRSLSVARRHHCGSQLAEPVERVSPLFVGDKAADLTLHSFSCQ